MPIPAGLSRRHVRLRRRPVRQDGRLLPTGRFVLGPLSEDFAMKLRLYEHRNDPSIISPWPSRSRLPVNNARRLMCTTISIAAGGNSTCALKANGSVVCWIVERAVDEALRGARTARADLPRAARGAVGQRRARRRGRFGFLGGVEAVRVADRGFGKRPGRVGQRRRGGRRVIAAPATTARVKVTGARADRRWRVCKLG